jgi:hypothetical protein
VFHQLEVQLLAQIVALHAKVDPKYFAINRLPSHLLELGGSSTLIWCGYEGLQTFKDLAHSLRDPWELFFDYTVAPVVSNQIALAVKQHKSRQCTNLQQPHD